MTNPYGGAIFVGGYDRTGTTLMQGLLCTDEATIQVTTEAIYFRSLVAAYRYALHIWDIHTYDFFDSREAFREYHLATIHRFLHHVQARFGPGKRIVLKEPALAEFFPTLASLLDDCLLILMIRDPRDAIASQVARRLRTDPNWRPSVAHLLNEYMQRYQSTLVARESLGTRLKVIHYEDLVLQTQAVFTELRAFTGLRIPLDPRTDEWITKRDRKNNESWSPLDGKQISTASVGKFQTILTNGEQKIIDQQRKVICNKLGLDPFHADSSKYPHNQQQI